MEVGELLSKLKEACEHGGWGEFLAEYDLARSTADDYIRRYKDEVQITESRQFEEPNPTPLPDPEKDAREAEIKEEQDRRKGKPRTHHQTEVRPTIKNLQPHQTARYWVEYESQEGRERIASIWYQAFLTIIREEVHAPNSVEDEAESGEVTSETVAVEEVCTAS